MSQSEHVDVLRNRHANLERQIEDLSKRPQRDDQRITELKRQKLLLKDKIKQMTKETAAA